MATETEHPRPDIERIRRDVDRAIEQLERSKKLYSMRIWPLIVGAMAVTTIVVGTIAGFIGHAMR